MKVIIYLFIFLSAYWLARILVSYFWLKREKKIFQKSAKHPARPFILVIPVLEEKEIILSTIDYFLKLIKSFPGSKLAIVTTAKEEKICEARKEIARESVSRGARDEIISLIKADFKEDLSRLSEIEVLKKRALEVIDKYENTLDVLKNSRPDGALIVNYPFASGGMAHQLNFCLKSLINRGLWKDELLGVYNTDSRPDSETLFWLSAKNTGSGLVFQQFGNYFGNIDSILKRKFISRTLLFSSAVWQNRWSIGFEIFNSLKQFIFSGKNIFGERFIYPLNYCIGHGLFFTRDIFEKHNFSEKTYNEDAIWGLELSYEKKMIIPLPFFDISDAPNSIKSLFFQKATWFFGPFEARLYFKKLRAKISGVDSVRLFLLSGKLFSHAIFWLFGPTALFLLFLNALVTLDFAPFLLCYLSFLVLPGFLVYRLFPDKKIKTGQALIFLLIGSFFAYVMHGASAYYSIFLTAKSMFTKQEIVKYKTKILRD